MMFCKISHTKMDEITAARHTIGDWMRECRETRGWPLRKVAAQLDVDTSIVSRVEKGQRRPTREMVNRLAELFETPLEEVLVLYLSDQVAYELASEDCANTVLRVAEEKIKYLRTRNARQGEFKF
jgi:transcriptional regulator with XRE-family HTH domain